MSDAAQDEVDDDPDEVAFLRKLARVADLPSPEGELRTGDRLARFAIVKSLGAGGMGAVYEAKDETLGRSVALKVMRRASDEARKRFIQEARAAAAVSHPNLITVHEVGEADGRAFIVMELIRGKTLRALAPTGDEALRIIREVVRGVAAAHAAGIVHRDLKPENVMIGDDGTVKVLDFGIARLATGGDHAQAATALAVTGTGVVVGTPQYMSPEQALGIEVDARSDVYSFGVLAYETLTGKRPGPNPPSPKVSPLVDDVLVRCLAADPLKRFADAREICTAFDGAAPPRPRGWPRRALAAVVVLALVGSVVAWRLSHDSSRPVGSRRLEAAATVTSANRDAVAAYRAAFQQLRDAMFLESVQSFEHAAELDPSFAAAHLRLGLMKKFFHSPEEAQRSFAIAVANRAQLDKHDQALLHATEPAVVRWPYDYGESRARLLEALEQFPDDAELLYHLAMSYSELGEHDRILPILDRMKAGDPTAPIVWSSRAITLLYLGDRRGAREAALECRRVAPTQGGCAFELEKILDDDGACGELETLLRAWQLASQGNPRVPRTLARAMLVQGRPLAAVREHFARARSLMPEAARAEALVDDDFDVAWQTGDLVGYERVLRTWLDQSWNASAAVQLADLLEETGRGGEARALAEKYFAVESPERRGTSDLDLYNDRTGLMLAVLSRTGAITQDEFVNRRTAWGRELDASIGGTFRNGIWAQVFAVPTRTADEAIAAVKALQPTVPLPPFFWFTNVYGAIGRTFELAGRHADALPYLERATKRCLGRDQRDFYYLGLAREGIGDTRGACAAYHVLIERWALATTSITVQHARERSAALHCD